MTLIWKLDSNASPEDLTVISEGVFAHARQQARDGNAQPTSCVVCSAGIVVAGGSGRTEYGRLFVSYHWVAEELRGQGIGRRVLAELESEAFRRGCRDALVETLDDGVANLYARLGYQPVAVVRGYVGRFNRHIMVKPALQATPAPAGDPRTGNGRRRASGRDDGSLVRTDPGEGSAAAAKRDERTHP